MARQEDIARNELAKVNWAGPALPFLRQIGGYYSSKDISALLRSSIYMILTTKIGTRPWRPEFGSMIPSLVFEPNDQVLTAQIRMYSTDAIARWEPRVRILSINTETSEHILNIEVVYMILATGAQATDFIQISREQGPLGVLR